MRSAMLKTTLREIKKSMGRFISILAIIALGVGFFAGLKICKPDMINTADSYLKSLDFYDYRLICTLGFTDRQLKIISENSNVKSVQGGYDADFISMSEDGTESVLVAHSIGKINRLSVVSGRLPQKADECVIDARYFSQKTIGQKITLSDTNSSDTAELFGYNQYTVTGLVNSPAYLNYERDSTSLLNGTASGFVYMLPDGFNMECYSSAYLLLQQQYPLYSSQYDDYIDRIDDDITMLCEKAASDRLDEVKDSALDKYNESYAEYTKNLLRYNDEKQRVRDELDKAEKQLEAAEKTLIESETRYKQGVKQADDGQAQIDKGKAQLSSSISQVVQGIAKTSVALLQLDNSILLAQQSGAPAEQLAALTAKRAQAVAQQKELVATQIQLLDKQDELAQKQLSLDVQKLQLAGAKAELEDGKSQLEESRREYSESKETADRELEKAEKELKSADEKLKKAKKDIGEIKKPDSYTLGRDENIGYVCYKNDSAIVDGIATVFPVFFFLVAALICITTMSRMVEEQRADIGVFKALGYTKRRIMLKYVTYSGSAAVVGCILGFFAGSIAFPLTIWQAYTIMYGFADIQLHFSVPTALALLAVSLICAVGSTVYACYSSLSETAAQIMRPRALKAGKRTLIERTWLFKRLKFLQKVSIRNVIRYKQRFVMMVLGIGGCTALLITGFGLRDSIQKIANYQYDDIMIYDASVGFSEDMSERGTQFVSKQDSIKSAIFVHESSYEVHTDAGSKNAWLVAAKQDGFSDYISLHYMDESVSFPGLGEAVVTRKFAQQRQIAVGTEIEIFDGTRKSMRLRVSGICDNYVYDYIFADISSCADGWGYTPSLKTAYVNVDKSADIHSVSAKLMDDERVISVKVSDDIKQRVTNMLQCLDYIVALIILCAGALAFVVLYNLTNINITERIREIATIKVLGFYQKEVALYVFGENLILTGFGAVLGLLLGRLLHWFVMSQINIDMISFDVLIEPLSFGLSILLTFVFALLVDFIMYFKLDKVDMAQSLKSVE